MMLHTIHNYRYFAECALYYHHINTAIVVQHLQLYYKKELEGL